MAKGSEKGEESLAVSPKATIAKSVRRLNIGPLIEDNMVILAMELARLKAEAMERTLTTPEIVKFERLSKVLVAINKEDREERKQERLDQLSDEELRTIIDGTIDE